MQCNLSYRGNKNLTLHISEILDLQNYKKKSDYSYKVQFMVVLIHFMPLLSLTRRSSLVSWLLLLLLSLSILTLSSRRSLSYSNQSTDVLIDWFLYDRDIRHKRVKQGKWFIRNFSKNSCSFFSKRYLRPLLNIRDGALKWLKALNYFRI